MEINQAWIDEQRAVCEKVTPATDGDLRISEDDQILVLVSQYGECRCWRSIFGFRNRDDAEFVINAYINYPAALDALEASMQREAEKDDKIDRLTELLDKVLPRNSAPWMAYNNPIAMTAQEAAYRIRQHMQHHGFREPRSVIISTALRMGADVLE